MWRRPATEPASVMEVLSGAFGQDAVGVGSAVAQRLVEVVPVAGDSSHAEVEVRVQDFFLVRGGRSSEWPAGVVDDDALAVERLVTLGAHSVGRGDVDGVAVRVRLREQCRHRLGIPPPDRGSAPSWWGCR